MSLIEDEFVVPIEAVKKALWLKRILNELWLNKKTVQVFYDNQNIIQLIKNPVYHERTKHIDVQLQFIREEVARGTVVVSKIHTNMNLADPLSKVLPVVKFKFCVNFIGVLPNSN